MILAGAIHLGDSIFFFQEFKNVHCNFIFQDDYLYLRIEFSQNAFIVKIYYCIKQNIPIYSC